MLYREYIDNLKSEWVGKSIMYKNKKYNVVDVDYNGYLLIDKKAQFTDTTAVDIFDVVIIRDSI